MTRQHRPVQAGTNHIPDTVIRRASHQSRATWDSTLPVASSACGAPKTNQRPRHPGQGQGHTIPSCTVTYCYLFSHCYGQDGLQLRSVLEKNEEGASTDWGWSLPHRVGTWCWSPPMSGAALPRLPSQVELGEGPLGHRSVVRGYGFLYQRLMETRTLISQTPAPVDQPLLFCC